MINVYTANKERFLRKLKVKISSEIYHKIIKDNPDINIDELVKLVIEETEKRMNEELKNVRFIL